MLQQEATYNQYLFCLVFYLIIVVVAWRWKLNEKNKTLTWILALLFCLFSYFNSDYFHYEEELMELDQSYKDFFYYYIAELSGRVYWLFRLIIWGAALLLFYLTSNRLGLQKNLSIYVFAVFFLPTFCYARASLAMALYFYGLSFLANPKPNHKILSFMIGLLFILASFLGHRSFLVIIALTPVIFIRFRKWHMIVLLLAFPFILNVMTGLLTQMMGGTILNGEGFESFSESATRYSELNRIERNWKFQLITNLKYIGFYIPLFVILLKTKFNQLLLSSTMSKYLSITIAIFIIATSFLLITDVGATDVLAYRFLFMTGIPITLILCFLIQEDILSFKEANLSMFIIFISTILFIAGKIYTLHQLL